MKYVLALAMIVIATTAQAEEWSEQKCMAMNIYHEARGQSVAGQVAVALVTRNRVADKRFPNTVCSVVKQGPVRPSWKQNGTFYPVKNRCQFSWWCDGKSDKTRDKTAWKNALNMANWFSRTRIFDFTDGATFYHAFYVTPGWAKVKERTGRIEDHIFYRWKQK
jgi:N-acetylmuramoyl-L-alanine amidase